MTAGGVNADGKRSEKIEAEDSLRTVECLRGRLLAERVASRNAKEEVEQMENKLIELEKKLNEESKSRNRAEKKLKFLLKKLESLNISYISDESELSASVSLEKSEISSVASSSTKEAEDKETNSSANGETGEFIQNSNSSPDPENLQQNKEETKGFEEKSQSPKVSNNSAQNASSSAKDYDNPAAAETISSCNDVNCPEFIVKEEEIEGLDEKSGSPEGSNHSVQSTNLSAKVRDDPAALEMPSSSIPELTVHKEEIDEFNEKSESSSTVSNNSEQNASSSAKNCDNHVGAKIIRSTDAVSFPDFTMKKEETEEFKAKSGSPKISIKYEQNASQISSIDQFNGSSTAQLETSSLAEDCSSKSNEPESTQKAKKEDRSLRSLFKKENMNEDDDREKDDQVDNSLALVPVDLPKKKQTIDPVILDATVKEVLDALRNAKEKLQTSMERRRNSMIKVG